jgi:hypothetical protein
MKTLGAVCCMAVTVGLGVLAGGTPERDVFVKVSVTGGPVAPDTIVVSAGNIIPGNVAVGQRAVPVYDLSVLRLSRNREGPIYLKGLRFYFAGHDGGPIDPSDAISRMYAEVRTAAGPQTVPASMGATAARPPEVSRGGSNHAQENHEFRALSIDPQLTEPHSAESDPTGAPLNPARVTATHTIGSRVSAAHTAGSHLDVELTAPALISPAESLAVRFYVDLASAARTPGFVIKFDEGSFLLEHEDSPQPLLLLNHGVGRGRTMYATTTVISERLRDSFTNYPNPFAAGRELTTFAFYLTQRAEVRLRIFTGFGSLVKTLDPGTLRPGGTVQEDIRWDGTDERGATVQNGAYFAVLDVRYADGRGEEAVRKVAVLR